VTSGQLRTSELLALPIGLFLSGSLGVEGRAVAEIFAEEGIAREFAALSPGQAGLVAIIRQVSEEALEEVLRDLGTVGNAKPVFVQHLDVASSPDDLSASSAREL
jgi:hypothetical protein